MSKLRRSEGDRGRAICPVCERRTSITYRRRAIQQIAPKPFTVPDVVVGVCDECDSIALIPRQATPSIADAIQRALSGRTGETP